MSAPELVSTFYEVVLLVPAFEQLLRDSGAGWEQFDAPDAHLISLGPSDRRCLRADPEVILTIQECLSTASYYRRVQYNPQDAPMLLTQVDTTDSYRVAPTTSRDTGVEVVTR